jgi:hypothetical protein
MTAPGTGALVVFAFVAVALAALVVFAFVAVALAAFVAEVVPPDVTVLGVLVSLAVVAALGIAVRVGT